MKQYPGESYVGGITATRKSSREGNERRPCSVHVSTFQHVPTVILRTLDASGKPPLVAVLNPEQALELAALLRQAASNAT